MNNTAGHVRIFQFVNGEWMQKGTTIYAIQTDGRFGSAVSISCDGTILSVGEFISSANGSSSGSAYVYQFLNNDWQQIGDRIDGDGNGHRVGISISMSSDGKVLPLGSTGEYPVKIYDLSLILEVNENDSDGNIVLHPNPALNSVTITSNNTTPIKKVFIHALDGTLVSNIDIRRDSHNKHKCISFKYRSLYSHCRRSKKQSY